MYHHSTLSAILLLSLSALAAEPAPVPSGMQLQSGSAAPPSGTTFYSSGPPTAPADLPSGQPPYGVGVLGVVPPGQPLPGYPSAGPLAPGLSAGGVMVTPMPAAPQPSADTPLPPPRVVGPENSVPGMGTPSTPQVVPPPEGTLSPGASSAPFQMPPLPASMNLDELRQDISRLQTARRALATERATLAQTLPSLRYNPAQEGPCTTAVQERVRSLMEQLRQAPPERPESEPAPLPAPRPPQKETPVAPPVRSTQPAPPAPTHSPEVPPSPAESSTSRKAVAPKDSPGPPKKEAKSSSPAVDIRIDAPIEPLGLAQALFEAGDYDGALKAYRILEQSNPSAETLAGIQYMIASCLRKLGKMDEAVVLYREVASSDADELIAETAQWQLSTLKARRELDARLEELRQRRVSLMEKKQ